MCDFLIYSPELNLSWSRSYRQFLGNVKNAGGDARSPEFPIPALLLFSSKILVHLIFLSLSFFTFLNEDNDSYLSQQ